MTMVQFAIGMGVFAAGKIDHNGDGIFAAFGHAMTSTPVVLAIHAWVGVVIVGGSIHTLMSAMAVKRPVFMATSILGALSMIGAAFSGAAYVNKGGGGASVSMAVLTVVALACYLSNVVMTNNAQEGQAA
ncbi:hypothetical protein [Kitasatospora sp. NPDC056531]|uniref:hypothetical protein n=1 Tax=Kitasatospora sp. NPDC056531 TaxID=3345856 RepID=UPI0036CE0E1D